MSNEKLLKARHLIDEGKYSQARKILKRIDDPKAQRLLSEIEDLSPAKQSGARDIFQVLVLGLIFTAIFGGIGYGIASSMGIPKSQTAAPIVNVPQGNEPDSTRVAVQPSPIPTATDIPCEAQSWWDANRAAFGNAVNTLLTANVQTSGSEINNAKSAFTAWKATFEAETVSPCVSAARQSMLNAAPQVEAAFDSFLTATNEQQRAQSFIAAMDALLRSADQITQLNVDTTQDTWVAAVQNFSNSECPAKRWYIEAVQAKGYPRFFELFNTLDFNQTLEANTSLRDMQTLRSSYSADSANFPECVKTVSDSLLAAMDGFLGYGNARLDGDIQRADSQLQVGNNQLTSFYTELSRLEPTLSGVRF